MPKNKIIAIILLITGAGLAFWGYQLSGSVGAQLSKTLTGSFTDKVMILYISGAASFVVGTYLLSRK
jgi:H+/gluconate symporter-like permease